MEKTDNNEKEEYISPYCKSKGNNDNKHSHHRSLDTIYRGSKAAGLR